MCKALLMKNEIILFTDGNINIEVQINPEQETVWLTQKQIGNKLPEYLKSGGIPPFFRVCP